MSSSKRTNRSFSQVQGPKFLAFELERLQREVLIRYLLYASGRVNFQSRPVNEEVLATSFQVRTPSQAHVRKIIILVNSN